MQTGEGVMKSKRQQVATPETNEATNMRLVDSITKLLGLAAISAEDNEAVSRNKWDAKMTWRCRNGGFVAI